jgi:hypothetical protein
LTWQQGEVEVEVQSRREDAKTLRNFVEGLLSIRNIVAFSWIGIVALEVKVAFAGKERLLNSEFHRRGKPNTGREEGRRRGRFVEDPL